MHKLQSNLFGLNAFDVKRKTLTRQKVTFLSKTRLQLQNRRVFTNGSGMIMDYHCSHNVSEIWSSYNSVKG